MNNVKATVVLAGVSLLLLSACGGETDSAQVDDIYESLTGTANPYTGMSEEELSSVAAEAAASNQAAVSSIMAEPIPNAGPKPELCKKLGDDFLADEGYTTYDGAWVTTPQVGDEACNYAKLDGMDSHGLTIKEMSPSEDLPEGARLHHKQEDVDVEPSVPGAFISRFEYWDDTIYGCTAAVVHGGREYHAEFSITHSDGTTGNWRELCPEAMRLLGRTMEKIS